MTGYTPSDDELYEQIAKRRYEYDYTSPWEHLAPALRKLLTIAARNTMEPIIAHVRRDAKAEALRESADAWHAEHKGTRPGPYGWMWDRATEHETGDQT